MYAHCINYNILYVKSDKIIKYYHSIISKKNKQI